MLFKYDLSEISLDKGLRAGINSIYGFDGCAFVETVNLSSMPTLWVGIFLYGIFGTA